MAMANPLGTMLELLHVIIKKVISYYRKRMKPSLVPITLDIGSDDNFLPRHIWQLLEIREQLLSRRATPQGY